MLSVLFAWAGPLIGMAYSAAKGLGPLAFFTSADASEAALLGIIAIIVGCFVTDGDLPELLLTPAGGLANLLACLGLAVNLLTFFVFPHTDAISAWLRQNGAGSVLVYLAILAAVIFANYKKVQAEKTLPKDNPLPLFPLPIGLYLVTPAIIMYLYDGMAELDKKHLGTLEPNLDILHWQWNIKIVAVIFLANLIRFILLSYPKKRPLFWQGMAHLGNIALLTFLYLLLERILYPMTRVFFYLPMLAVSGFVQLYAYLYFLHGLIDLFFPGAVQAWRLEKEAQAAAEAVPDPEREQLEHRLDSEERLLNALAGNGPLTEEEALLAGRSSTQDYVTSKIYRQQKLDKLGKK